MVPAAGLRRWISWMNWLRSPRLNSAVHSVAVLTVFSLSRVFGFKRNVLSEDSRFADWRAEVSLQKIEVTSLVCLTDVTRKHPAVAALEPRLRRTQRRPAARKFIVGNVKTYAARRDIDRNR